MPDNWNKLADLLGTPSIDPIDRKPPTAKPSPKPTAIESEIARKKVAEPAVANEAPDTKENAPPAVEPKSRLKSTWDSVAEFFGVATPAPAPAAQEPPAKSETPSAVSDINAKKSLWQIEDDELEKSMRASQRASDELLGKRGAPQQPEDDLDQLLAGFRQRPEQPAATDLPDTLEASTTDDGTNARATVRETRGRGERDERNRRGNRSSGSDRQTERGERPSRGRGEAAGRSSEVSNRMEREPMRGERGEIRGRRGEQGRSPDDSELNSGESTRTRRHSSRPAGPRDAFVEDSNDPSIEPQRRGQRRPSRRAIAEGVVEKVADDGSNSEFVERNDSREDSTLDSSRRRGQRWNRDRSARNPNRNDQVETEASPRGRDELPSRKRRTSAWEDPELIPDADVVNEFDAIESPVADSDSDDTTRRRRRRRRTRSKSDNEGTDEVATTGRQIYGRHADESEDGDDVVEGLRTSVIVPWVDAISVIVDKNMNNHRHTPQTSRGGRSGSTRGGNGPRGGGSRNGGETRGNSDGRSGDSRNGNRRPPQ